MSFDADKREIERKIQNLEYKLNRQDNVIDTKDRKIRDLESKIDQMDLTLFFIKLWVFLSMVFFFVIMQSH